MIRLPAFVNFQNSLPKGYDAQRVSVRIRGRGLVAVVDPDEFSDWMLIGLDDEGIEEKFPKCLRRADVLFCGRGGAKDEVWIAPVELKGSNADATEVKEQLAGGMHLISPFRHGCNTWHFCPILVHESGLSSSQLHSLGKVQVEACGKRSSIKRTSYPVRFPRDLLEYSSKATL